jgi:hypothetical protein
MDSGHQLPARRSSGIRRRTPGSPTSPDRVGEDLRPKPPNGGGEDSPPWIFLSYCHEDAHWREEFSSQLAVAESQGLVKVFFDGCIEDGASWELDVQEAISKASVAILLLTRRFLTSEYSIHKEMKPLLERLARGEDVRIIPVLVEPCHWWLVPGLSQLQIVTFSKGQEVGKGRALSELPPNEIQAEVAQQAWKILKGLVVIPPDDPDRPNSALAVPSVSSTTTAKAIRAGSNVIDAKRRFRDLFDLLSEFEVCTTVRSLGHEIPAADVVRDLPNPYRALNPLLGGVELFPADTWRDPVSLELCATGSKHSDPGWCLVPLRLLEDANAIKDPWRFRGSALTRNDLVGSHLDRVYDRFVVISFRPYLSWDYEWGFIALDNAGERSGQRSEMLPSIFGETLSAFRSLDHTRHAPLHTYGAVNRELFRVPNRFNVDTTAADAWVPDGGHGLWSLRIPKRRLIEVTPSEFRRIDPPRLRGFEFDTAPVRTGAVSRVPSFANILNTVNGIYTSGRIGPDQFKCDMETVLRVGTSVIDDQRRFRNRIDPVLGDSVNGGTGLNEHVWRVCADWYQNVIGHIANARAFTNLLRPCAETPHALHFMGHGQTLQASVGNPQLGDGTPPVEEWTEAWLGDELDNGTPAARGARVRAAELCFDVLFLAACCSSGTTTSSPMSTRVFEWDFVIDDSRSPSAYHPESHPSGDSEVAALANGGSTLRFSLPEIKTRGAGYYLIFLSGIDLRSSFMELVYVARRDGRSILENPEEDRLIKEIVLDESGWSSGAAAVNAPSGPADLSGWGDMPARCPWNGLELWREPVCPKGGTPAVS